MKKSQSNYYNMGKGVYDVFNSRPEAWKSNALITEGVGNIGRICGAIGEEAVKQETNATAGYTASLDRERTRTEDLTSLMAKRMKVFAHKTGNDVLAAEVSFSRSSLDQLSLNRLLVKATAVAKCAALYLSQLEPYQVTEGDVEILQASIAACGELSAHRTTVKSEHIENTGHLEELFDALRKELKLMDTQVEAFVTDEEFLKTYFIARRVHDVRGGSGKKPEKE
jgi:hypothetical protein